MFYLRHKKFIFGSWILLSILGLHLLLKNQSDIVVLRNQMNIIEDSLSWVNITFENYELRRQIYEDLKLLEKDPFLASGSILSGVRSVQVHVMEKLFYHYKGGKKPNGGRNRLPQKALICDALRNVNLSIYQQGNPNFPRNYSDLFPLEPFIGGKRYPTCALVSNSGSVNGSQLGKMIDSHDFVFRFNHATVDGYTSDVGSKTDLRILNSLILKQSRFDYLNPNNTIYHSEETIYIAFEKSKRNQTFPSWSTQFKDFLTAYANQRKLQRDQRLYMLDYKSLWSMQDWLGSVSEFPVKNYIPSSGFIGLHLALRVCDVVRLFEFIPSGRETNRCHYFEGGLSDKCGYDGDHSFAAEKLVYYIMGNVDREEIFKSGYLTIDTQHCYEKLQ